MDIAERDQYEAGVRDWACHLRTCHDALLGEGFTTEEAIALHVASLNRDGSLAGAQAVDRMINALEPDRDDDESP